MLAPCCYRARPRTAPVMPPMELERVARSSPPHLPLPVMSALLSRPARRRGARQHAQRVRTRALVVGSAPVMMTAARRCRRWTPARPPPAHAANRRGVRSNGGRASTAVRQPFWVGHREMGRRQVVGRVGHVGAEVVVAGSGRGMSIRPCRPTRSPRVRVTKHNVIRHALCRRLAKEPAFILRSPVRYPRETARNNRLPREGGCHGPPESGHEGPAEAAASAGRPARCPGHGNAFVLPCSEVVGRHGQCGEWGQGCRQ